MPISYNGTQIDKITFNGVEIMGGSKVITTPRLYTQYNRSMARGYCEINSSVPIMPTSIKCNLYQNNSNGSTMTWNFLLQGKNSGTGSWDTLASKSVSIERGRTTCLTDTFTINTPNYYTEYRVQFEDPNRAHGMNTGDEGNYIIITGTAKL